MSVGATPPDGRAINATTQALSAGTEQASSRLPTWEFAGWGRAERITDLATGPTQITHLDQPRKHMLGTWRATALCGNDITSSVLYVSALATAQAGALAPIALLLVSGVLYLFRSVYAEVGSALPLNGGTYTVLLNTTRKSVAAAAACLTLLSYVATAVISAGEAAHYASALLSSLDVTIATVGLLALFALLNIIGITESATVALGIFVTHLVTLSLLLVLAGISVAQDPSLLAANWELPDARGTGRALFFGFAAAMLGISGFESSANFIEEQRAGVFPRTLRNMWLAVTIFNPAISLLALGVLPLARIRETPPDLLSIIGGNVGGRWLATLVSIDAVLVLSGAVLTSFVGTTGLVRRMSLDRCLPQVLLRENRWRGTNHWIILGFFALCVSILWFTRGDVARLAAVYTLSFLGVMALFALGNMLLKQARGRLPRETRAGWGTVTLAFVAAVVGLVGSVLLDRSSVLVFAAYFAGALVVVGGMLLRLELLALLLRVTRATVDRVLAANEWIRSGVMRRMHAINSLSVVYFTRGDNVEVLNSAALYVLRNEQTNRLRVVHVYEHEENIPRDLANQLAMIDRLYPRLRIDFLAVQGVFGPQLIEQLSRRLDVPKNLMFIGTPGDRFPHRIEELGGVRVIL